MHRFYTIAGIPCVGFSPVSVMTEDGEYLTAIEIAKAMTGRRIVLLKKSDDYNTLKLLNPSDIITESTDFIVVDISDRTMESCVKEGLIDIAKWLLAYMPFLIKYTLFYAAFRGNIEFAQWAHSIGCPWGINVMRFAAIYNHIELAKWAHANGCPWYNNVIKYATNNRNLEFAEWARANGCPEN